MIKLGEKEIKRSGGEVYIIAEIGQNHQGSIKIAKQMILEAKKAGCNCVKFQKSCLSAKFTQAALERLYDGVHSWGKTYGDHKTYLEFSEGQYRELQEFSREQEIDFTASAMDEVSLDFLDSLNVPFIKIGSGDANNFPLIEKAAKLKRPLVISTGMQTLQTLDKIVEIMRSKKKHNYALMHCVSSYPTAPTDATLQIIALLRNRYPDIVVGYSGHELCLEITYASVLLGAKIVERHMTLNKEQKGSDHKCSLEPTEFTQLVDTIKKMQQQGLLDRSPLEKSDIFNIVGNKIELQCALKESIEKIILPCELSCKNKLGKSVVSKRHLEKGHRLQTNDICIKVSEPNGIPADQYKAVLGTMLQCNVKEDEPIKGTHISKVISI